MQVPSLLLTFFFKTLLPKVLATHPAGSSTGQFLHFVQNILSKGFNKYDYGFLRNKIVYGSRKPPSYDTSKVIAKTFMYYGDNDFLSHPIDVKRIAKEIKNTCALHHVKIPSWNHMDYLWAVNVKELVNIPLRDRLLAFDQGKDLENCKK